MADVHDIKDMKRNFFPENITDIIASNGHQCGEEFFDNGFELLHRCYKCFMFLYLLSEEQVVTSEEIAEGRLF